MRLQAIIFMVLAVVSTQLLGQASVQNTSPEQEKQVDALFERWNKEGSTGAAISIIKNGEILYQQAYGMANLEYNIPIDPTQTVFEAASISKQFTSFCLLLLERAGKVSLEDDIRKYIPEVPDFGHTITLRHLATHTSGLRDQWNLLKLAGWRMDDVINNEHVFKLISRQKELNFVPGAEFRYSNTGHTLLAEVVSRVSGQAFAEFARQEIFEPLAMSNSLFFDDHEMIVENLANSYNGDYEEGFRKATMNISSVGATNLFTTAEDMAKWAANFDYPVVGDQAMIDRLNAVPLLNDGTPSEYALGQFPIIYKGLEAFEHSGAEAAYESYFIRFPEQQFAVAVFSNDGAFWAEGKGRQIADIYLAELYAETPSQDQSANEEVKTIPLTAEVMQQYCAEYWNDSDGLQRAIELENGLLYYVRSPRSRTKLLAIADNNFVLEGVSTEVQIHFAKRAKGEGYEMVFVDGDEQLSFKPLTKVSTEEYQGRYYSEELDTYYRLEAIGDVLVAHHQRVSDITLHPITRDQFHSRTWFFKNINFQRGLDGKVKSFRISNRGVTNLLFIRQ